MNLAADYAEILSALSSEGAEFLLVGGYAVMVHTEPRYTRDLDLWVRPTLANARRVLRALKKFGAPDFRLKAKDLLRPDLVLIIGVEPIRIDLLTGLTGLEFSKAWARRVPLTLGATTVGVLAAEDLIRNKRKVGRPQDLLDVAKLEAIRPSRRPRRATGRRPGR